MKRGQKTVTKFEIKKTQKKTREEMTHETLINQLNLAFAEKHNI